MLCVLTVLILKVPMTRNFVQYFKGRLKSQMNILL